MSSKGKKTEKISRKPVDKGPLKTLGDKGKPTKSTNTTPNPNRIRLSNIDEAIWRPSESITPISDDSEAVLVFTILGKEDGRVTEDGELDKAGFPVVSDYYNNQENKTIFAEDLEHAYAKSVCRGRQTKYFVKKGSDGRLYNPLGLFTESRHSKMTRAGLQLWKYGEVDRNVFLHYVKFLTTRNQAWLTTAQREIV